MDSLNRPVAQNHTGSPAASANGADAAPEVPVTFSAWLRGNAFGILVVLGLIVLAYVYLGEDGLWNAAKVALGLGFVIFIHELGHFAVAKWCDVYVETFSIGFGPALPGCSFKKGETMYKIALFPLGGYVKMLGEGEGEGEEEDDNPRSFKNKSVGQRMAIISAGVVMNLISACIFFVWVYLAHGERRIYGTIGSIEPGTPAWEAGVRPDSRFLRIGDIDNPYFDDLQRRALLSSEGEKVPVDYTPADSPRERISVLLEARRDKHNLQPMIGMLSGSDLKLVEKRRRFPHPVVPGTPAAEATPPFQYGDVILGTTDPANPAEVKAIRTDKDTLAEAHIRLREYRTRLEELAGKPMVYQVRRAGPDGEVVDITVPPAYHHTLGLRMRMGQITAVRHDSPASRAGIQLPDPEKNQEGDIITEVVVEQDDGTKLRFGAGPKPKPDKGMVDHVLDPVRLPWELKQWARRRTKGERYVQLTVVRKTERGQNDSFPLPPLKWDEQRQFDREEPNQLQSPMSIPALGLAYQINTAVEAVEPNSPAAKAGVKEGDLIKAFRFQVPGKRPGEDTWDSWRDLESNQWASVAVAIKGAESRKIGLRLERGTEKVEVTLASEPDTSWPRAERGLILDAVEHLQHAEGSFFKALELGINKTYRSIQTIYLSLKSMITNRISPKNIGGPIMIVRVAYDFAGQGFYEFLMFLALISVNLAVINFLPIPLLDGGHMVLLIYEKLRGKPASDRVQYWLVILGIAIIATIFLFASYQDIMRWFF